MAVGLQERRGMIQSASNEQIDAARQAAAEQEERPNEALMSSLAAFLKQQWEAARNARLSIEEQMIDALRQRNGEYRPDKLSKIRAQGGSEIFMMLTNIKCRAAESWIRDILFQQGEEPYKVEPTPIPDLPDHIEAQLQDAAIAEAQSALRQGLYITQEQVRQRLDQIRDEFTEALQEEANSRSERMQTKIEDQLTEGGWHDAMEGFIKDVVTFPAGILKGPVIRRKRKMNWGKRNGQWQPFVSGDYMPRYYRVSPFDFYPSPNSRGVNDGYVCERHRLRRKDLVAMKGVEGYDSEAIDHVLREFGMGGLRQWLFNDQVRADLEQRPNEWWGKDETIDAIEYHGSVMGQLLRDWGMSAEQVPDPLAEYEINAWLIGPYVIRAILNPDPLGRRPYYAASFEEIPGAFWGYGVPQLMQDVQDVANAAARSLVNNMAIASGPLTEIYSNRMAPGEDITQLYPWRIIQTQDDPNGTNNPAVRFYQPASNAEVLMKVYDHFARLADEYSGIPAYTYGNPEVSGAGDTASGLSMLMTAASRGIKQVISHIDEAIEGSVQRQYEFNMLYESDEAIKGDAQVRARGAQSLIAKEQQQIRRTEFLNITNNPTDVQIMGLEGRAELLRQAIQSLDVDADEVIPDKETLLMRARQAMQAEMQQGQGEGGKGADRKPKAENADAAGNPAGGGMAAMFQQPAR